MNNPIFDFEKAAKDFLNKPSQETFQVFINEFAGALINKCEVHAMIIMEDIPEFGGPCMRLNKMTMNGKPYFAFYTNSENVKKSVYDSDYANLPLDIIVDLTLGDETIAGLIVNPSAGADASIPRELIEECVRVAKNYADK